MAMFSTIISRARNLGTNLVRREELHLRPTMHAGA
jgi:hypothetical protein